MYIPRIIDLRVKLSSEERKEILAKYNAGMTIASIARDYPHVSRRLVQFVLFPERKRASNPPGKHKKYYDRKKNTDEVRRYYERLQQNYIPSLDQRSDHKYGLRDLPKTHFDLRGVPVECRDQHRKAHPEIYGPYKPYKAKPRKLPSQQDRS